VSRLANINVITLERFGMIAFEIEINGKKLCTAGIDAKFGVLTSILSWAKRDVGHISDEAKAKLLEEELKLTVGGHISYGKDDYENVQWSGRELKPGDQIEIKIIETDEADEPKTKKRSDPKFVELQKRKYFEKLKKEYE
jgi:hypothetical protein